MAEKKYRLGILGAGRIAPVAVIGPARDLGGFEVAAIASRDAERAEAFARRHAIPKHYADYASLLNSDTVDCVYIALPNHLHAEWICRAAEAGKHILAEKPLCLNQAEFARVRQSVSDHGVHLLEAMMVQHHPWQPALRDIIARGDYGRLQAIRTRVAFMLPPQQAYRLAPEKGGGAFYDMGPYWLQFIQACFPEEPLTWDACADIGGSGVDMTFTAGAYYRNGLKAELVCSFERPFAADHWLDFETATVYVHNFFGPAFGEFSQTFEIARPGSKVKEKFKFPPQNYYGNQLAFFHGVLSQTIENLPLNQAGERVQWLESVQAIARKRPPEKQATC